MVIVADLVGNELRFPFVKNGRKGDLASHIIPKPRGQMDKVACKVMHFPGLSIRLGG